MQVENLIEQIKLAGFSIEAHGEHLAISPISRLSGQQRQFLKQHKQQIVKALKAESEIVTVAATTSQGRFTVDMEISATPADIAQALPSATVLPFRLRNGEGGGVIIDREGEQSARVALAKRYGERLEHMGGNLTNCTDCGLELPRDAKDWVSRCRRCYAIHRQKLPWKPRRNDVPSDPAHVLAKIREIKALPSLKD